MKSAFLLCLTVTAFGLTGCATDKPATADEATADPPQKSVAASKKPATAKVDFTKQVKPIIQERCVMCHNKATMPNRHSFESRELVMNGDSKGPIIIPGDADGSRFIVAIVVPDVHETAMPPVSSRITKAETETLKQWISEGADWPSGRAGRITPTMIPRE
jgi:uncharacterized membrane protein